MQKLVSSVGLAIGFFAVSCLAADDVAPLARQLRELDGRVIVLGTVRQPPLASMLARHAEARLRQANRADQEAWSKLKSREDWVKFQAQRTHALQQSLGVFPRPPRDLQVRVTGKHQGDGYFVQNLVYVSRPGLVVTANLYQPSKSERPKLPGIVICHSHQSTKHSGWRQDMAMTWARAGCVVLVPDHLGHGERRQHPFGGEGQHDYHFRYDAGMQLHLVGESLLGWLVWDLMRGVDVLFEQPNVDRERIVLISEPAGGGDVAAVTAALDGRITCAMVQNFGGPQPETAFPLPADSNESFAYAGSGSWESTRNLRLSARDGFLPWSIVAAIAPRKLIYYHEFYWDRERDPVWQRLQQVHEWQGKRDSLVGLAGRGFVVGSAPENTHWLPENRALLYPVLERWLQIPNPGKEYSQRLPETDLHCLTPEISRELGAQPLHALLQKITQEKLTAARESRAALSPAEQARQLQSQWQGLLGATNPQTPVLLGEPVAVEKLGDLAIERIHLSTEPGIVVPVLILRSSKSMNNKLPLVIGVAQQGKQEFLKQRAEVIARLLQGGSAVCLLDVRGTGESSPGEDRGRRSSATSISATELMLGQTVLGGQLRDLRAVLQFLRTRDDLDRKYVAMWGESFSPVNPADVRYQLPHTSSERPVSPEPLGGLLALLAPLFEEDIQAAYVHRSLADCQSALRGPFCYLPHDAVIPGLLASSDLPDLTQALAGRPIWLNGPVDDLGRALTDQQLQELTQRSGKPVQATADTDDAEKIASWLLKQLE